MKDFWFKEEKKKKKVKMNDPPSLEDQSSHKIFGEKPSQLPPFSLSTSKHFKLSSFFLQPKVPPISNSQELIWGVVGKLPSVRGSLGFCCL